MIDIISVTSKNGRYLKQVAIYNFDRKLVIKYFKNHALAEKYLTKLKGISNG